MYTSLTRAVCENCRQETRTPIEVRLIDWETELPVLKVLCAVCAKVLRDEAA